MSVISPSLENEISSRTLGLFWQNWKINKWHMQMAFPRYFRKGTILNGFFFTPNWRLHRREISYLWSSLPGIPGGLPWPQIALEDRAVEVSEGTMEDFQGLLSIPKPWPLTFRAAVINFPGSPAPDSSLLLLFSLGTLAYSCQEI